MPAATDTATGRPARAAVANSWQTPRITCGLTANIHTPAPRTASAPDSKVRTPKSASSALRVDSLGAATRIEPGSAPPASRPPIRLRAMLPPPMNAMEAASARGAGGVIGCVLRENAARSLAQASRACRLQAMAGWPRRWRQRRGGSGFVTQVGGYTAGGEYAWVAPGAARARIDTAEWAGDTHGYRRTVGVLGQEQGLRPASVGGPAADDPGRWRRAPDQHPGAGPQAGARAGVRHHVGQAAARLRGVPRGRLLVRDPRPGALPRQRLQPEPRRRRGVPYR